MSRARVDRGGYLVAPIVRSAFTPHDRRELEILVELAESGRLARADRAVGITFGRARKLILAGRTALEALERLDAIDRLDPRRAVAELDAIEALEVDGPQRGRQSVYGRI